MIERGGGGGVREYDAVDHVTRSGNNIFDN